MRPYTYGWPLSVEQPLDTENLLWKIRTGGVNDYEASFVSEVSGSIIVWVGSLTKSEAVGCSAAVLQSDLVVRRESLNKSPIIKNIPPVNYFIGLFLLSAPKKCGISLSALNKPEKVKSISHFKHLTFFIFQDIPKFCGRPWVSHKVSQCIEVFSSVWRVPKLTQCNELCPAPWSRVVSLLQLGWKNNSELSLF